MDKKHRPDWRDYVSDEKVSKFFTTDIETIGTIRIVMDQYGLKDQSQTIDALVNLGLACLGFKNIEEVIQKIKINNKITMSNVDILSLKKTNTFDALSFTSPMENVDEQIASIISSLCNISKEGYAERDEIIKKGELQSISVVNIVGAIDKLKRNGRIVEPQLHRYCTASDYKQRD